METLEEKAERESNDIEAIEKAKRDFDRENRGPLYFPIPFWIKVVLFPIVIIPVILVYMFTFKKQFNKRIK